MHLFVPPSHLKVAIVVFVNQFTVAQKSLNAERARHWGSVPQSLKQRVPCVHISSDTTVWMQATSESWLDRVWA